MEVALWVRKAGLFLKVRLWDLNILMVNLKYALTGQC